MHGWKMLAAVAAANFQLNALAFAQPHSLGDTLITEWLTCTHEATDRLSEGSNEPAEMIVIKVFDACSQIEEAYYLDLQHSLKLSVANADNVKAGLRSIAHKRIIAEVLACGQRSSHRSSEGRCMSLLLAQSRPQSMSALMSACGGKADIKCSK